MSAKQQERHDFINTLRSRLNVKDQDIANLELRMAGKSYFNAFRHLQKI